MGLYENCRAMGIKYIDMSPDIQSDVFVNEEYKGAVINNIGRYLEADNLEELIERAKERLDMIDLSSKKINNINNPKVMSKTCLRK